MTIYTSIEDLPIRNWFKIQSTNDLQWLRVDTRVALSKKELKALPLIWELIFDEFIDTFGISDEFRQILELQREIMMLKNEDLQKGTQSNVTLWQIKQLHLDSKTISQAEDKTNKVKMHMERFLGRWIDEKVLPVKDYYTYLYSLKEMQVNGRTD